MFEQFANGDGVLTTRELAALLAHHGYATDDDYLAALAQRFGGPSGRLGLEEFDMLWHLLVHPEAAAGAVAVAGGRQLLRLHIALHWPAGDFVENVRFEWGAPPLPAGDRDSPPILL
eukprot:SAG11_NODE_30_length_23132_cov_22.413277_19_plen_117_part_00